MERIDNTLSTIRCRNHASKKLELGLAAKKVCDSTWWKFELGGWRRQFARGLEWVPNYKTKEQML